jgi:tRNA G18 (ribose-2'-O)-methylase SpoU
MAVEQFVQMMNTDKDRPPLLVVETAKGAISLHEWRLKKDEEEEQDTPALNVMLGGEQKGVHQSILAALRPGYDHIVYVPMPGFCVSMNVATCLAVVLFEVRRQYAALGSAD